MLGLLAQLTDAQGRELITEITETLAPYLDDLGLAFPQPAYLAIEDARARRGRRALHEIGRPWHRGHQVPLVELAGIGRRRRAAQRSTAR